MRKLTSSELDKIHFLTSKSIEVALIEPTSTGLNKSIMDATLGVRDFLDRKHVHNYESQKQGPDYKVLLKTSIITENEVKKTQTSLYRPKTKKGDPRIWVSGIREVCKANDILAIAYLDMQLWVFNLTTLSVIDLAHSDSHFANFVKTYTKEESAISVELLEKLRAIAARGYIESPYKGDTSVGRLLETELGIKMNSSKNPDYKGIELKTARSKRKTRNGLFAQVPDWSISRLKSTRELLDEFGYYDSSGVKRLECTLRAGSFIPQGLSLEVDDDSGLLNEISNKSPRNVVSWKISKLEERLLEKHAETFWIEADVKVENGIEWFKFTKVKHTKDPMVAQFTVLLTQGKITLDHMIKERGRTAVDKGPAFKLEKNSLPLLFPPAEEYSLDVHS